MNEMKISISCDATCWEKPLFTVIEFWGWRGDMVFAAIRPMGETNECGEASPIWDEKDLSLFMGEIKGREEIMLKPGQNIKVDMKPIKILEARKCKQAPQEKFPNDRTLKVETCQGTFYLPDLDVRKGDTPTFNGQPLRYLSHTYEEFVEGNMPTILVYSTNKEGEKFDSPKVEEVMDGKARERIISDIGMHP